jgi:ketosteroid isomerase-like protein
MKQLPPTFKTNDFQLQRLHSSIGKSVICRTLVSFWSALLIGAMTLVCEVVHASDAEDERILAALDTKYQRAVQDNNATTMAAILADNFLLIDGDGTRSTKADLIKSATDGKTRYEHQEDSEQTVLVAGDTGIVTAKLWAKGIEGGRKVDYMLWFSDVYVRTPSGWRYLFGQASLPLPRSPNH